MQNNCLTVNSVEIEKKFDIKTRLGVYKLYYAYKRILNQQLFSHKVYGSSILIYTKMVFVMIRVKFWIRMITA